MKKVLTLITIAIFVSCGKSIKDKNKTISQSEKKPQTNPLTEEPSQEETLSFQSPDIEINAQLEGFDSVREEKMKKAIKLLKKVVNSQEFKRRVLEHKYKGEKTFVNNEGLSNQEIYDTIVRGSEQQFAGDNSTIDLVLHLYYKSNNTVGYTYPSALDIYVNRKYFDPNSLSRVAANIAHEWTHKLGFGHTSSYNSARPYSIPYAIGDIVTQLGAQYED